MTCNGRQRQPRGLRCRHAHAANQSTPFRAAHPCSPRAFNHEVATDWSQSVCLVFYYPPDPIRGGPPRAALSGGGLAQTPKCKPTPTRSYDPQAS